MRDASPGKGSDTEFGCLMSRFGFDRLQFEVDIGVPEPYTSSGLHSNPQASQYHDSLMKVVDSISEVSGGLSYQYAKGTWAAPAGSTGGSVVHERETTLNMRIIVMPRDREVMYERIRSIISRVVRAENLPCDWIQVCETPLKQRFFQVASAGTQGRDTSCTNEVNVTSELQLFRRSAKAKALLRVAPIVRIQAAIRGRLSRANGISFRAWRRYRVRMSFASWMSNLHLHSSPVRVKPSHRNEACSPTTVLSESETTGVASTLPHLTFKDFIRPTEHAETLARLLGAQLRPPIGVEQKHSGPEPGEAPSATLISCCGSYIHRMRELGYIPLAAPVLDFGSVRAAVEPPLECTLSPRSFSVFVTRAGHSRIHSAEDIAERRFENIGINDCAASGAGALVAFALQAQVPWRRAFYGGKDGGDDSEIVCPLFVKPTGSHFESLSAVLAGKIDVAIVDVVVLMDFKRACAAQFEQLHVIPLPVGSFLYYPIWLASSHAVLKESLLQRLNEMPPEILGDMYIKSFRRINWEDFEGNPPIVPD